ncbi:MAG: glycerol-3-phosphate dehydrogenase [Thermoplasmatota archaeon]
MREPFDLIVVGGGINGAGIARDAAMRGLRVCLLERGDWGEGTSSKSSMLAHGGLRYLEQFDLPLVHEALQDRELMLRQAPHLVRPLRFVYPLYPDVASRRTVRVGLWLYDQLSHGKSVPKRAYLKREALLQELPALDPENLAGGATYYDGQFQSVERFVLELVLDARAHGADCRNHTNVRRIIVEDGTATGVELEDGTALAARTVINACGPWVDELLDATTQGPHHLIRKTKGTHIAVKRFLDTALIVRAQDGRTFFFIPWHDVVLIGTTDTDHPEDAATAQATPEDVAYLVSAARRYFPEANLDVLWTYAGVRPLLNQQGLTESAVSRRHALAPATAAGLWSVQGGKLTTYRHLAEQAVTKVCRHLGMRAQAKARPTRMGTLPGGPLIPWQTFREQAIETAIGQGILPISAAHLVDTYGARWQRAARNPQRIQKGLPHVWGEIDLALEEDAQTLADVMLRRTRLGLGPRGRMGVAAKVATHLQERLGWTDAERTAQMDAYREAAARFDVPEAKD